METLSQPARQAQRRSAPGDLGLVQRFVNTLDLGTPADDLRSPEQFRAWVRAGGLGVDTGPLDDDDLVRAVRLREALRALLLGHGDGHVAVAATAVVEEAARLCPPAVRIIDGAPRLVERGAGLDLLVSGLIAAMVTAAIDGTWMRLKICPVETCRVAFFDSSKNASSRWCVMEVCGNRAKARRFRERRRADPTGPKTAPSPGYPAGGGAT